MLQLLESAAVSPQTNKGSLKVVHVLPENQIGGPLLANMIKNIKFI